MNIINLNIIHKMAITDANIPTSLNRFSTKKYKKLNLVPIKQYYERSIVSVCHNVFFLLYK